MYGSQRFTVYGRQQFTMYCSQGFTVYTSDTFVSTFSGVLHFCLSTFYLCFVLLSHKTLGTVIAYVTSDISDISTLFFSINHSILFTSISFSLTSPTYNYHRSFVRNRFVVFNSDPEI